MCLMKIIKGNILTIDISDDKCKHVIVDKEKGRYLGHVSTARYSNDDAIYVVYVRGHGRGQGIMRKSKDFGLTWSNDYLYQKVG